jgi:hypothetical protein
MTDNMNAPKPMIWAGGEHAFNVTVAGSAGASPKDHAAMGAAIAKSAEQSIRMMIMSELRTQNRPGGTLR